MLKTNETISTLEEMDYNGLTISGKATFNLNFLSDENPLLFSGEIEIQSKEDMYLLRAFFASKKLEAYEQSDVDSLSCYVPSLNLTFIFRF